MLELDQVTLADHGAQRFADVLAPPQVEALRGLAEGAGLIRSGKRVYQAGAFLIELLSVNGAVGSIAASILSPTVRPVRVLMFDKTPDSNWALAWHQDRTLAVAERLDAPGFGPWSAKDGVTHVAPPIEVLERMITIRAHLDDCGEDNSPLLIALGSHRIGKVAADQAAVMADEHERLACHASVGDVWVYSTPILHASEPATSPSHRRVLQVDYADFELPFGLRWAGLRVAGSWAEENAGAIDNYRERTQKFGVFGEDLRCL